jgi:hypothetical protein
MTERISLVNHVIPSYFKEKEKETEEDDNVEIGLVPTRQTHLVISKDTEDDDDIWMSSSLFYFLDSHFLFLSLYPIIHRWLHSNLFSMPNVAQQTR